MIHCSKHTLQLNLPFTILIMVLAIVACSEDNFNAIITQENALKNNQSATAPIPGNNGLLIVSAITEDSATVQWTLASDNSPSELLQYQIVVSPTLTLFSLQEILQSGLLEEDKWSTEPVTQETVTNLLFGKQYFVNVCVRDPDNNISIYYPATFTTIGRIYLFSAGTYTGAMASSITTAREDINELVRQALQEKYTTLPQDNYVAFISIDSNDAIINFPDHYGVPTTWAICSPNGDVVAYNWYDLLDGTIIDELQNLGVCDSFWWSGSNADGSCDSLNTCNGWTNGSNSSNGRSGAHNTDKDWMCSNDRNCNNKLHLLGLCW